MNAGCCNVKITYGDECPAPTPTPDPTPVAPVCTFDAMGWSCDDATSCTADANGDTLDQDGMAGCDAACDPNGMDAAGMACTTPAPTPAPTPAAPVCTFNGDGSGWACDDATSCTTDANGDSLDQAGAACDATCDPNGVDAAGMACTSTRRLAVQDALALGQN